MIIARTATDTLFKTSAGRYLLTQGGGEVFGRSKLDRSHAAGTIEYWINKADDLVIENEEEVDKLL